MRSSISRGRGEVGQVRGTFFEVLRVCRNPVYYEAPADRASHSCNALVWCFKVGYGVSESKASATIVNLLLRETLYRKV